MKKVILSLIAIVMSVSAFAQITVVENQWKEIGATYASALTPNDKYAMLEQYGDSERYTIFYKDAQYQHITDFKSFSFEGKETLDGLYDILNTQMKAKKGTKLDIQIGNALVTIESMRMLGIPYLYVYVKAEGQPMGFFMLEPTGTRSIDKLFGKSI